MPSVGQNEDFEPQHQSELPRPIPRHSVESDHGHKNHVNTRTSAIAANQW